jgi:MerR family transcriptional regulator, thiopeptide resistance regulator
MHYAVGQVAGFAGVTVRTLHHYDEIGLLSPSARTHAGHRRYDDADLDRLQQVLYYRELGFPLDEIAALLDDPDSDPMDHLRRRHRVISGRIEVLRGMAAAVERAMEARKMGINLTPEEKFEVFGDHDPDAYAEETEQRWGNTEAYRQSQRRTAGYTKADWQRVQDEQNAWGAAMAELIASGAPADGTAAMDLAEEHRQQICRNFYDCDHALHGCLAAMYTGDERFTAYFEKIRPGMAQYLHDAILANAARHA